MLAVARAVGTPRTSISSLLNVEPRALYRCKEERKRCSQKNKVLKKELPGCCRDHRKSASRRYCYIRRAQEERQRDKIGRGGHRRSQCRKKGLKGPENESRC